MRRIPWLLSLTLLLLVSTPRSAHADLIDFGNGLIYDTNQDLTWLDPAFWNPGDTTWLQAHDTVAGLDYLGLTGWRLPHVELAWPGPFDDTQNEFLAMVQQLGWAFPCADGGGGGSTDRVADRSADRSSQPACGRYGDLVQTDTYAPFQAPFSYHHVWVDTWPYYTDMFMGIDFPDDPDVPTPGVQTFAVRPGAPDAVTVYSVPEPGTWALVGLGLGMAAVTRARQRVARA